MVLSHYKDKIVWITGASSGFGEALAKALDAAGAKLILSARRKNRLDQLAATLQNAKVVSLDLEKIETFAEKTQEALQAFGAIDLLIHNGAVAQNAKIMETSLAVERKLMEIDYFSYTELTRQVLPHMIKNGGGQIAVISGLLAHIHLPGRSTYAAAKAALIAYFGTLRSELIGQNIDITVLVPGAMQTELISGALTAEGEPVKQAAPMTGCSLNVAAEQALRAISDKKTFSYIGLEDESYQLWKVTLADPEKGTALLLNRLAPKA